MPERPESSDGLTVVFVRGATPGKWGRVWAERMPRHPLILVPAEQEAALDALTTAGADAAFVRLPLDPKFSAIPLYSEQTVALVAADHPLKDERSVTLAGLADYPRLDAAAGSVAETIASGLATATMPHSVARDMSRRDLTAIVVSDAPETTMALAWLSDSRAEDRMALLDELIGIVRGRTARSSRGRTATASDDGRDPTPEPHRRRPGSRDGRPSRGRNQRRR